MKVYVSVDMEGVSGVERLEEVTAGLAGYPLFRQIMAGDANAVIDGAIRGGATKIVVGDGHALMCNIRPGDLDARARLKSGPSTHLLQFKGISEDFDAVLLVGYHAKSGTPNGVLSHTFVSSLRDVRLNGASVGEAAINAFVLGTMGIPVIFLSGDDTTILESRELLGDIEYVEVKKARDRFSAEHLPLNESRPLLRDGAYRAVSQLQAKKPEVPVLAQPFTLEVDLAHSPTDAMPDMLERNWRFLDTDEDLLLSDFEMIRYYEGGVNVVHEGTLSFNGDFSDAYRGVTRIAMHFLHRNLDWITNDLAQEYERDLSSFLGDAPLRYIA